MFNNNAKARLPLILSRDIIKRQINIKLNFSNRKPLIKVSIKYVHICINMYKY